MKLLQNIVLDIPYLFLKKIPYAWIIVVMFWTWPPVVSVIFLVIILAGIGLMLMQQKAWEAKIARDYRILHRDEPRAPLWYQVRSFVLVLAGSFLLGWLLQGQFGLTLVQWGLLASGLMFLYRDAILFGRRTVYLVTNKGIAIRYVPGHIDYRLFFGFDEMRSIEYLRLVQRIPAFWSVLVPLRNPTSGLLLNPKNLDGFSKQIQEVFISPTDIEAFIKHFPPSVNVAEQSKRTLDAIQSISR